MPYGDKTGPDGRGPMTGRAAGYCAGNDRPGVYEPGFYGRCGGRRGVFGRGFGRGRRGFTTYYRGDYPYEGDYVPVEQVDEESVLKKQADWLKNQLDSVTRRLENLLKSGKKQD